MDHELPTPAPPEREHVTLLLRAASEGDRQASEQLLPLVYEQLRRLASGRMRKEAPGQTLQPTALVHEAYVRLVGDGDVRWDNRGHFFGAAALAMRRILVDRARDKARQKRGGDQQRVPLTDDAVADDPPTTDLVGLDDALTKLEAHDRRKHDVVMLRYFAGLTIEEAGAALSISTATVKTEWAIARVWLCRAMGADPAALVGGVGGVGGEDDERGIDR